MIRKLFMYLCLSGFALGVLPPSPALAGFAPGYGHVEAISAASPAEMGRKLHQAFEDFKAGLNPVLVALLYVGIIFGALIAFAVVVMFAFFLIMVLRRH